MKLLLLALLFCSATASAQRGPFVDPQQQIDLASPGSTVHFVQPGFYRIRVTKPLTLVGEAGVFFQHVDLAGPGSGAVTFTNMLLVEPTLTSTAFTLEGGGFSEIKILYSEIVGRVRIDNARYVELTLTGVDGTSPPAIPGTPTIGAKGATVALIEATVFDLGGAQIAVQAAAVYRAASVTPQATFDAPINVQIPDLFHLQSGQPHLGGQVKLSWTGLPGPLVEVWASFGTQAPTAAGNGFAFLLPSAQLVGLGYSTGSMTFSVPNDYSLFGKEIAFQAYDAPNFFSRPVVVAIH